MLFRNRYDGIDAYAAKIIRHKARQLVGQFGFTEADREDLEQELVLDLLRRLPKYDPSRAQRNTFIARVVENKVATIIEARKAAMRDYRLCRCSLNDRLEDQDGRSTERIETINQDDYFVLTGKPSRPVDELLDLSIDLRAAVSLLPPNLCELYRRLCDQTVTEISRDLGIPRGTIYDMIRKIRAILDDAGIRDYL